MRNAFAFGLSGLAFVLGCGSGDASSGAGGAGGGSTATATGGSTTTTTTSTTSTTSGGGATSTSSSTSTTSSSTSSGAPECSGGNYDACSTCCGQLHPAGVAKFGTNLQQCACNFGLCQFKCQAFCGGGAIDAACMENIAWNFNSPGFGDGPGGGNFGSCAADADCNAYGTCLMTCAVGRGPIPKPPPGTTPQQACVYYVNAYRAWEGLAPLSEWTSAETCVDGQIAHDAMTKPHDWFGMCGESTQNECYGFSSMENGFCASMLYSEKFSGDQGMGHYKAMTGPYSQLACGFAGSGIAQDYK